MVMSTLHETFQKDEFLNIFIFTFLSFYFFVLSWNELRLCFRGARSYVSHICKASGRRLPSFMDGFADNG